MLTGGYPGGKLDLSTLCQVIQALHLSSIACLYIDAFANYILCGKLVWRQMESSEGLIGTQCGSKPSTDSHCKCIEGAMGCS